RRVDGDDCDPERVVVVGAESAHELVGQGALAGSAGTGDPQYRTRTPFGRAQSQSPRGLCGPLAGFARVGSSQSSNRVVVHRAVFGEGDGARDTSRGVESGRRFIEGEVAGRDDLVDHGGEAESLTLLGREDLDI